jgi:hypothetical protein
MVPRWTTLVGSDISRDDSGVNGKSPGKRPWAFLTRSLNAPSGVGLVEVLRLSPIFSLSSNLPQAIKEEAPGAPNGGFFQSI